MRRQGRVRSRGSNVRARAAIDVGVRDGRGLTQNMRGSVRRENQSRIIQRGIRLHRFPKSTLYCGAHVCHLARPPSRLFIPSIGADIQARNLLRCRKWHQWCGRCRPMAGASCGNISERHADRSASAEPTILKALGDNGVVMSQRTTSDAWRLQLPGAHPQLRASDTRPD